MEATNALASLQTRVTALEQRARRATFAAYALGLALACGLGMAFTAQQPTGAQDPESAELRAQRFVLVDGKQRVRGLFKTDAKGQPSFALLDAEGRERASLRIEADEVLWTLLDQAKENRLGMSVDTAGLPHVVLNDKAGRPRMHLSLNPAGRPNLLCLGDEGKLTAGIGLLDDGKPWLRPSREKRSDAVQKK